MAGHWLSVKTAARSARMVIKNRVRKGSNIFKRVIFCFDKIVAHYYT